MDKYEFLSPVITSLKVTVIGSAAAFLLAVIAAWLLKDRRFRGRIFVDTILLLPLVLPPSVVGFGLLTIFGRNSPVGQAIEWLFHQPVVFTWWAAVISCGTVSFPLIFLTVLSGFEQVEKELEEAALTLGAGKWQLFLYVICPLAWRALLTGYILGFCRALGEFGATLMFAGNIPGVTQTMPTAIYIAVESGHTRLAYDWVILMVAFSFILLAFTQLMKKRRN